MAESGGLLLQHVDVAEGGCLGLGGKFHSGSIIRPCGDERVDRRHLPPHPLDEPRQKIDKGEIVPGGVTRQKMLTAHWSQEG